MATVHREGDLGLLTGQGRRDRLRQPGPRPRPQPPRLGRRRRGRPPRGQRLVGGRRGGRADGRHRSPRRLTGAQVVALLLPDQVQPAVYEAEVAPNLEPDAALLFAHGFNVHYGRIEPPAGHDVIMVAPKGPGHIVRRIFTEGYGTPALVAVAQDASGQRARARARLRRRDRRRARRRDRDDLRGGDRERPVRRAGRALRRRHGARSGSASRRSSRPATSPRSPTTSACTS